MENAEESHFPVAAPQPGCSRAPQCRLRVRGPQRSGLVVTEMIGTKAFPKKR